MSQTQTSFPARLLDKYPVQTYSVKQGEENQYEATDADRREWFEFIRNLSQECRDKNPQFPACLTRFYLICLYGNSPVPRNCRF